MNSRRELVNRIRFELEQLSIRNGQYDFEHLCRNLARHRICSNILPATGPVSGGGDQGRDFESFRTYLQSRAFSTNNFIGLVSEDTIAFCCTITQSRYLTAKIKSDIDKIIRYGLPVLDIHYFCSNDYPISKRHKLIEWASSTHSVKLEIHDGNAISEYLADSDIFWVAVEYLNISSNAYPISLTEPEDEWYQALIDKWQNNNFPPDNFKDFYEIKSATRHATFKDDLKKDLQLWIKLLKSLIEATPIEQLKRKSIYEISVAALRGQGSLIGYEEQIYNYFKDIPIISATSDLEDLAVLWTYCTGAYRDNLIQISSSDLSTWHSQIIDRIESELNSTLNPGRRCALLDIRGFLYIIPSHQHPLPDLDGAIKCWLELISLVDKAPLFPLERLADHLTELLSYPEDIVSLSNNPDFFKITQRIDELLSSRNGSFIAADKCRDRAIVLFDKGELLLAIKQIHIAKINWFSEETVRGSILSALFTARCYLELGFAFAAKYYCLATAYFSIHSNDLSIKRYVSSAFVDAALSDYTQGCYCGFFDISDLAINSYRMFGSNTEPSDNIDELGRTLFHSSVIHVLCKYAFPEYSDFVRQRINNWQILTKDFQQLLPIAEESWQDKTLPQIWLTLEDQCIGRPFGDFGKERIVTFYSLGISWEFKWENTYDMTVIAEEFLSTLQILLADFASLELCLLRSNVFVEICRGVTKGIKLEPIPSNKDIRWKLFINDQNYQITDSDIFTASTQLLFCASLLPREKLFEILENAFASGLSEKVFYISQYGKIYDELIGREKFHSSHRESFTPPQFERPFKGKINPQVEWRNEIGPGYSKDAANVLLENRYKNSILPIRHTIKRLSKSQLFNSVTYELKQEGWLDWHILLSVALVTVNYRINKELSAASSKSEYEALFQEMLYKEENPSLPEIPLSEFSIEKLRFHLSLSYISTLKGYGLTVNQQTPNLNAIGDFLGQRYNYWIDDIEHPDFGF